MGGPQRLSMHRTSDYNSPHTKKNLSLDLSLLPTLLLFAFYGYKLHLRKNQTSVHQHTSSIAFSTPPVLITGKCTSSQPQYFNY